MGLFKALFKNPVSLIEARSAFIEGQAHYHVYGLLGEDPEDLTKAINNFQKAVDASCSEDDAQDSYAINLYHALEERYEQEETLDDLNRLIQLVEDFPLEEEETHGRWASLARLILTRYERVEDLADLARVIQLRKEAVDLCPPPHPKRPEYLDDLADAIDLQYKRKENLVDLALVIQYRKEAVDLCPPPHPKRSQYLNFLAWAVSTRYWKKEDLADINSVIQYRKEAVDLCPPGDPDRPKYLDFLADAIDTRYNREKNPADLTLVMQYRKEAVDLSPPPHPKRPEYLDTLADAIDTQYKQEGNLVDLALVIKYRKEAVDLCSPPHPKRSEYLTYLAWAIRTRYEREKNPADLTLIVQCREEVLDLCPPDDPERPEYLDSLADAIDARYKQEGNLVDLGRVVKYRKDAMDLCPPPHPKRPEYLTFLAWAIDNRYEQEKNLADLTLVIQYRQEAVDLCPPPHPKRSDYLTYLAWAIHTRYEREKNPADLTLIVQCREEVLDLCPPKDPERPNYLDSLADAIDARYKQEGNLVDLGRVVKYRKDAVDLCPPPHPKRPEYITSLAWAIDNRYEQEKNLADLTLVIQYRQEAVDLCPPPHPNRSNYLTYLACAIDIRYKLEGNLADLACFIQYLREAVDLCPPADPNRSRYLGYLVYAIHTRYKREGNPADLTLVIRYCEESLELCHPGHPNRSSSLLRLAQALYSRDFQGFGQPAHSNAPSEYGLQGSSLRGIIERLREASSQTTGCSPRDCLKAALFWVKIAKAHTSRSTLDAYTSALEQLEGALALDQSLNQRHNRLSSDKIFANTKDLGVDAATQALQEDYPERAVELLEQGRGLLFAQIGRYRVELDDLRKDNSELADNFARLSDQLNAFAVLNQKFEEASLTAKDPHERYSEVFTEWTEVVKNIRRVHGFHTFLKPTPYDHLRKAAVGGPVIILIPSEAGTVALIISSDADIHRINLPHATTSRLTELSDNLIHVLNYEDYTENQRERKCADGLASLWNDVVRPIAEALQYDLKIPRGSRVWWCPTSVATRLPLHAAGLYLKGQPQFPNLYISSYTPTVQALLRAQRTTQSTTPKKLLLIVQPTTPKEPPLPQTLHEAFHIMNIVSPARPKPALTMKALFSEAGNCEAVQHEMTSHPWVHFMCHGVQKADQPLGSYLSLGDGHLTLRKIIEQNLPNADFAFLSACHSAAGDKDLANESLHLAAAMQFIGFRGVVATLWQMRDIDGPPLAEAFYKDMVEHGDHRKAAEALRKAVNHLRRNKVPIHCWMRFVHIGA